MPELPEVENIRLALVRAELEANVTSFWRSSLALRTGRLWRDEGLERLRDALPVRAGQIQRRAKFLVWSFSSPGDSGTGGVSMIVHLGMSGQLRIESTDAPHRPHTHLVLSFEDGRDVRFVDPRRFGGIRVVPTAAVWTLAPLNALGPEPLEPGFGADVFARVSTSKRALRDVLLDQRVVAGLGNIYVLEALHRAGLHPLEPACRLRDEHWARLCEAIGSVLESAISNGGTTFRDYRTPSGAPGRNRARLAVYGRAGQACGTCGETLVAFALGGRSGVFCPHDQPRLRGRSRARVNLKQRRAARSTSG